MTSPHDALFKATFSQVEHAAPVLRRMLPPDLASRIDFSSLKVERGNFIDEALKERQSDILFRTRLGAMTGFLYLLFEHQSTPDPLMPFRLLRYMVRIWEAYLQDNASARRLPAVLPIVLHHSESGWNVATTFEGILDLDADTLAAAGDLLPRMRFALDDISHETSDAMRARAMTDLGRLVYWCLRNARSADELIVGLREWSAVLHAVRGAPNGAASLALVWRYILTLSKRPAEEAVALLVNAIPEDAEDIVTAGEQLMERGRQEAQQEALRRLQRIVLKLLRTRFGALGDEVAAKVDAADFSTLETWAERLLTVPTVDDVFQPA